MFFFPSCLPIWFHSEQCWCQLISLCHRAPSNSWKGAMPLEYQTAKHSAEQSDAAQEEQSWCPQNRQTVLLGSIWQAAKSGSSRALWWHPQRSPNSNKVVRPGQSTKGSHKYQPVKISPWLVCYLYWMRNTNFVQCQTSEKVFILGPSWHNTSMTHREFCRNILSIYIFLKIKVEVYIFFNFYFCCLTDLIFLWKIRNEKPALIMSNFTNVY